MGLAGFCHCRRRSGGVSQGLETHHLVWCSASPAHFVAVRPTPKQTILFLCAVVQILKFRESSRGPALHRVRPRSGTSPGPWSAGIRANKPTKTKLERLPGWDVISSGGMSTSVDSLGVEHLRIPRRLFSIHPAESGLFIQSRSSLIAKQLRQRQGRTHAGILAEPIPDVQSGFTAAGKTTRFALFAQTWWESPI